MSAAPFAANGRWWKEAPALRFLALFLLGWIGVRAALPFMGLLWSDAILAKPMAGRGMPVTPATMKIEAASSAQGEAPVFLPEDENLLTALDRGRRRVAVTVVRSQSVKHHESAVMSAASAEMDQAGDDPSLALQLSGGPPALAAGGVMRMAADKQSRTAGWSISTWLFLRDNLARSSGSLPVAGELGGSQAGVRAAYALDGAGRVDVYGRMSAALAHLQQSEVAVGVSAAPIAGVPIRVAAERREKIGRDGRSAMAVMLVGGVSGETLPANFRLDAYGQAGVVGVNRRDAFGDGAVVVDRAINMEKEARSLRIGVVAAAAAQPRVERLDIGPRLTLPVPQIGKGARLALDWRQRVAGNALPKNGASLTIGADF